jgi:hypothetical protein
VILFVGPLTNKPDQKQSSFPSDLENTVKGAIRQRLLTVNGLLGYASITCSTDILFLETVLELGGEINIVLPYEQDRFLMDLPGLTSGPGWTERLEIVIARATQVVNTAEQSPNQNDETIKSLSLALMQSAQARAEQLETDLIPLVIRDDNAADITGHTTALIEQWQKSGFSVELIDLGEISQEQPSKSTD